jgi:hypothetical protein
MSHVHWSALIAFLRQDRMVKVCIGTVRALNLRAGEVSALKLRTRKVSAPLCETAQRESEASAKGRQKSQCN